MLPILAVFLGGAIGTAVRAGLDELLPHKDIGFPLDTLLINVVGSFVLAVLISRVWPRVPSWLRAGLGPGILGGFTTFSAVMVSMVTLAANGRVLLALGYLALSLVFGFGAALLGFRLAGGVANPAATIPEPEVDE